jgi:hypothetical protein
MNKSQRADIQTSQDLSVAALSYTTSIGRRFRLDEVIIHASVVITETITISKVSKEGANYTAVLASSDLVAERDFLFRPQGECNFLEDDEVKVECTQANLTGTVYLTIKTSALLQ